MARMSADLTLIAATILTAFSAAGPVPAEQAGDTEGRLLACADIGNPDDRLACFDSVVESVRPMDGMASDSGAVPAAAGVAATASVAARTPPAAAPATAAATGVAPAAAPMPAPEPQAIASPGPSVAPADPAPAAAASPEEDRDADTGSAVITGVRENLDGRFTVELDNGEVWRETEGSRVGMPAEGAGVTISRGVFGSYRMKIEGIPREARVRQVN